MKVLMLGNDPSVKGGITSVISQLLAHDWSSEGIDMKFIPTYVETNNVRKILFFAKALRRINKELKTNKPDVVHMHMSYKGSFTRKFFLHKLCKKNNIPDIIHLHGSEFKKWFDESDDKKKEQIQTLLKESAGFIVLGDKWNKAVKEIEPKTNTVVVSNTVHIPDYTVEWKQPFTVLFMGVLIKRKGVADLINAIYLLNKENKLDNVRLVIAGSGAEEAELKAMCTQLGLDNYIEFAGWTAGEKKEKLFRESQMLVLPSYNEGLPIAILEAISCGMPVVATNVGDISSAVIDGENGYLIEPGDVLAIKQAIEKIVWDPEVFNKMVTASRQLAESGFSDEKYFSCINDLYKEIGD
ncbi:glycosyltransferase family 4 protein [Lactococcus lactis]|uniref:glycosyltransferase family 4 protein n=1 Tax=Lactococcus lactis TaxID=1358 RepID=UPI001C0FF210|nr:glycosyltransferase family 4 protein [Lactococcus lactis]MBU5242068.1 glycosyltransferase family 4 protein [Lactococcus lactis]